MKHALFLILMALIAILCLAFFLGRSSEEKQGEGGEISESLAVEGRPVLRGQVHTPRGRPVPWAQVTAGEASVISDGEGRFVFEELPAGTHLLDAQAEGFVRPGPRDEGRAEVTVVEGGTVGHISLILQEPSRISGRVLARGVPVPDAVLGLYYVFAEGVDGRPLEPFAISEVARTDEGGEFSMISVAPGRLRVLVETEDYAFAESQEIFLRGDDSRENLLIDLVASGGLTGVVVTEDGSPVQAEVVLGGADLPRSRRLGTDEGGRFIFTGLPVGDVTLSVRAPGYRGERIAAIAIAQGETTTYDVILSPARGIFGRVVDAAGEAAPGVSVVFSSPGQGNQHTRTGADGTFSWDDPSEGVWMAVAVSAAGMPSTQTRATPGEELVLRLGASGEVAGRVVDGRGAPVDSYTIAVDWIEVESHQLYGTRAIAPKRIVRADGQFTFGPLRPGAYRFRVEAPALAPGMSERVVVRPGAVTSGVTIRLGQGARVVGRVTAAETGEPLAGVEVSVFEPTSVFPGNSTRTNADGEYLLEGVSSGRRSLRVAHEGYLTEVAAGLNVPAVGELRRNVSLVRRAPGQDFSFHGIGAILRRSDQGIEVANIMDGMPAQAYGLVEGDIIRSVDREGTSHMELDRVVEMIRGEEGAPVALEIEREGEGRFTLEVERGRVVINSRRRN